MRFIRPLELDPMAHFTQSTSKVIHFLSFFKRVNNDFMIIVRLSMYVTMFTTVSITFLRLLVWYASLLLGFALALFFLFDLNEQAQKAKTMRDKIMDETLFRKEFFSGMLSYFLRVLVMMTGEQDFGNLRSEGRFEHHPLTSRLVFLAFLFLITIVLFSFLNAMAISDIRDIRTKVLNQ